MATAIPTSHHQSQDPDRHRWPESCKYLVPELVDTEYVRSLLVDDTAYLKWTDGHTPFQPINYVDFTDTGSPTHQTIEPGTDWRERLSMLGDTRQHSRVIFIDQKRKYHIGSTVSEIALTCESWLALLTQLEIPPAAVELLHDNNGGYARHISYCSANGPHPCRRRHGAQVCQPCAYHLWVKLGGWGKYDHFAYASHDFRTGQQFVLVLGTDGAASATQLARQFQGVSQVGIFTIMLSLTSLWSRQIEEYRWQFDFATLKVESETGYNSFQFEDVEPLDPRHFSLSKDMAMASHGILGTMTAATNMANIFSFLSGQLRSYNELGAEAQAQPQQIPQPLETQLSDAFSQCISRTNAQIAQMQGLRGRLDSQFRIVKALVAQRDSRTNIEIATAAKADTELMRCISFITMIFLPATFLATFFSMVFFNINFDESTHLVVSKSFWLYPLCTIPLTIILVLKYGLGKWLKMVFDTSGKLTSMGSREKLTTSPR